MLISEETPQEAQANRALAQFALSILANDFPGRPWTVKTDAKNGILQVCHPMIHMKNSYVVHLGNKTFHQLEKDIKWAAGEFMERFGLPTGKRYDESAVKELKRDAAGNAVIDA